MAQISGPASLDLRFPGQWFQLETGLPYNWHRHYDPTTGRYTTPDPLGLHQDPQPSRAASFDRDAGEAFQAWLERLNARTGSAPEDGTRALRDGASLYAYAGSDPLQQTDPKGLQIKFLGPSPGLSHGNGRVCGIICGNYGLRLDFHPNPGPTLLHFHCGPIDQPNWGGHRPWYAPWKIF